MIGFLILGGYLLGIVFGLLLVAWRKAHKLQGIDGEMEPMAAFFWPLSIIAIAGYFMLVKPGVWAFDKAVLVFTPKPISPIKKPTVDETKSTYRNVVYEKE